MAATIEPNYGLACLEVWGGNRRTERCVELPGLEAWVYSSPVQCESAGGDVHYLSMCGQGKLTRIGLADVSGHGPMVSDAAHCLRELMRKHVETFDQSDLLRDLNQAFQQRCVLGTVFASFIFLGLYGESGKLVFSNGGHPLPLWFQAKKRCWTFLRDCVEQAGAALADLPLGLIDATDYRQSGTHLEQGDLLLLYSDGLSEACNTIGEILGPDGLLRFASALPTDSPEKAGRALLRTVRDYRSGANSTDDETLLALRRLPA